MSGYVGTRTPSDSASEFNAMSYLVTQILNRANTATLVVVKSVTNAGAVAAVGYVDIQPLVSQVDGAGGVVPHGIVHNVPYFRIQGGADAVILDPKVGDIGIAIFADHDISSVKASRKVSPPGSARRFDMSDGMYLGGMLNGVPTQYVQFSAAGIAVTSPTAITLTAPQVSIVGNTTVTGTMINNDVNIGNTHTHGGVQTGSGNSGGPH